MQEMYFIKKSSYYFHLMIIPITLGVAVVLLVNPGNEPNEALDLFILIPVIALAAYGGLMFIVMPQRIEVILDQRIKFISFWREYIFEIRELEEVFTESSGYYVIFKFSNSKKFKMLNKIEGLYELVGFLKIKNPDLGVTGL